MPHVEFPQCISIYQIAFTYISTFRTVLFKLTMGFSDAMRFILSMLLIILNVLGFAVGIVLMSLGAWMYVGYAKTPSLYETLYGTDVYEVLIFFMTSGAFLAVLSVIGLLAGVFSLMKRTRCFAGMLQIRNLLVSIKFIIPLAALPYPHCCSRFTLYK